MASSPSQQALLACLACALLPHGAIAFDRKFAGSITGWFHVTDKNAFELLVRSLTDASAPAAPVAEIGVFHGRSFASLLSVASAGQRVVAIDYFKRDPNATRSRGEIFLANMRHAFRDEPHRLRQMAMHSNNTFDLTAADVLRFGGGGRFAFVHVDAGHTYDGAMNDVRLAAQVLLPSGVIALDDYHNIFWPGVHAAVNTFLATEGRHLVAFMHTGNKVYLCNRHALAAIRPLLARLCRVRAYGEIRTVLELMEQVPPVPLGHPRCNRQVVSESESTIMGKEILHYHHA